MTDTTERTPVGPVSRLSPTPGATAPEPATAPATTAAPAASTAPAMTTGASGLRRIAAISASLVSTYALTSVLGLAFWLLAARQFSVASVGVGGAAIAMMTLLGTLGTCGLGTLLIARLPNTDQGRRRVLTRTALAVAGGVAALLAVAVPFVAIHGLGVTSLEPIAGGMAPAVVFALGTALMAVALVVDQAVLVLGSGSLQTERNAVASATKLGALALLAVAGHTGGLTIFIAWSLGTLVSLPLVAWRTRGGRALASPGRLLDWTALRGLGRTALSHHALNTTLQAALQLLPLIVIVAVSPESNGIFTTALQVTGAVFALPYAITVGLFAAARGDVSAVLHRMRFTVPVSLGVSVLANLVLFPLAPSVLSVFGDQYSADGVEVLRILALAGIPFVVKDHFVALRRVQNRTGQATLVLLAMTVVELGAAYAGVLAGGLIGLTAAWVVVLFLEAAVLSVPLVRAARPGLLPHRRTPRAPRSVRSAGPVSDAAAFAGVSEEEGGRPGRWRRTLHHIGPGPTVLLMSAGLLPMSFAVASTREAGGSTQAQTLYVAGLLVIFVPAAIGVLMPRTRHSTRVLLALAMALLLQLSRLVLYPTRFMFHDELIHANVLRLLGDTGRLFTENSLLPVTTYYPGLEVATNAVQSVTGVAAHTSAVVILLAARLVLALGILLLVARVTGSTRIGAAAVVIYACNPQMLFFNSQFSYQTLALPLAVLTVYLVASRRQGARTSLLPGILATVAVTFTHHVTAALLIATFVAWWAIEVVRRRGRANAAISLALMSVTALGAFIVTLLNPGNSLLTYLGSIGESSVQAVTKMLSGEQQRKVFQNSAGVVTAPWEKVAIIASILLVLAVLVPALWRSRLILRARVSLVTMLVLLALLYPLIPGGHLTVSTAEVGDRSAGFVFIGVAFVVAWWIWQRRGSWWRTSLFAAGAAVVFIGSVVLGAGSISSQLPGPFRVSDDARSIDPDNLAAANWMAQNLTPGNVVYADRIGGLLAAADGNQFTVTHIGLGIDASRLLLDPQFTPKDVDLIRSANIHYLVADRRDAFGLPNQGVYIESGEFGGDNRTSPPPASALRKFSAVPGVDAIYDNGSVVIYDLSGIKGGAR